jgi:hypothetical protein
MMNNIYLEALRELVSVFPVPLADYPDVAKKVHAALSQKPRNCDVGTEEEQKQRFDVFCSRGNCDNCPLAEEGVRANCAIRWAQMPYEEALEK